MPTTSNDSTPDHRLQTNTRGADSNLRFTMFEVTGRSGQRGRAGGGAAGAAVFCLAAIITVRERNSEFSGEYPAFPVLLPVGTKRSIWE